MVDFTREPIIESVITPKEGCKIVIRNSKGIGQEEYFVDAVEVVSFGNSFFFRSLERPKPFLVPATDYEILEVREARTVLKHVSTERAIKIGGGKGKEKEKEKEKEDAPKLEKKREKRRQTRRRRTRDEVSESKVPLPAPELIPEVRAEGSVVEAIDPQRSSGSSLLPPPPTLISETIARYKDSELFKDVFFPPEEADQVRQNQEFEVSTEELPPIPEIDPVADPEPLPGPEE